MKKLITIIMISSLSLVLNGTVNAQSPPHHPPAEATRAITMCREAVPPLAAD